VRSALFGLALAAGALGACKDGDGDDKPATKPPVTEPATTDDAAPSAATPADATARVVLPPAPEVPRAPLGLPATPSPDHNRTTPGKVVLGELLFFDPRLSGVAGMACATCHQPDHGWADPEPRSRTAAGKLNLRHTPSLLNTAYARSWWWDGRMDTLEASTLAHWKGQLGADPEAIAAALATNPVYAAHFERAFGGEANPDMVAEALAAFIRTLRSGASPWDRYEAGDADAVSADVIEGFKVFTQKAQCAMCHPPPLYADYGFHALGVGVGTGPEDIGRYRVTRDPGDHGAFKTPTLRGVAAHPPFFHDGSADSLEDAVDYLLAGGHRQGDAARSPRLEPVSLTPVERQQLLLFLRALSPERAPYPTPELP
jgi:cytochrome c peroxidase